jgi:hypothetical protein
MCVAALDPYSASCSVIGGGLESGDRNILVPCDIESITVDNIIDKNGV